MSRRVKSRSAPSARSMSGAMFGACSLNEPDLLLGVPRPAGVSRSGLKREGFTFTRRPERRVGGGGLAFFFLPVFGGVTTKTQKGGGVKVPLFLDLPRGTFFDWERGGLGKRVDLGG